MPGDCPGLLNGAPGIGQAGRIQGESSLSLLYHPSIRPLSPLYKVGDCYEFFCCLGFKVVYRFQSFCLLLSFACSKESNQRKEHLAAIAPHAQRGPTHRRRVIIVRLFFTIGWLSCCA